MPMTKNSRQIRQDSFIAALGQMLTFTCCKRFAQISLKGVGKGMWKRGRGCVWKGVGGRG